MKSSLLPLIVSSSKHEMANQKREGECWDLQTLLRPRKVGNSGSLNSEFSHFSLFHQTVLCHESLVLSYLYRAIWSNTDNVLDTIGFQMHLNSIWLLLKRDKPSLMALVNCS